jgi:hypothetical protein
MSTVDPKAKPDSTPKNADPARESKREEPRKMPKLDFAKLDLTVEKVEERISPSETNVFDK